jgi:Fur family ferric uptake transcriptional regulator
MSPPKPAEQLKGRKTRQKEAVQKVLQSQKNPLTPDEIQKLAGRETASIGIATVYRVLKSLQAEGRVLMVEIPGQKPRYELADKGHHHHFLCHWCNRVFELDGCAHGIASMAPKGFKVESHDITLYGRCAQC